MSPINSQFILAMMKYATRQVTITDKDLLFDLHKKALDPYVDEIFGWDDQEQRELFNKQFNLNAPSGCLKYLMAVDGHFSD